MDQKSRRDAEGNQVGQGIKFAAEGAFHAAPEGSDAAAEALVKVLKTRAAYLRERDKAPSKDGVLSNTALLLAALWAWYRGRMDEPVSPRNWDLNRYVPRQRAFDGILKWLASEPPSGRYRSFEK